jgi:hypothetical protein
MLGKHRDLKTNHLILVSRAGFAKKALEKAAHYGAVTMTLNKARRVAWTKIVGKLPQLWPATFVWRVQSCRAVLLLGDSPQDALITDPLPSDLNVHDPDGNSIGSLRTLIGQRVLGADGASIVQQEAREDGTKIITYALEFGQEQYLVDLSGMSRQVAVLLYEIALDRITGNPVRLKTAS